MTAYYIHPNGNDANPGTLASPWLTKTPFNAHTFAAGDACFLWGGTMFTGPFTPTGTGTPGQPVLISSYGPGLATISAGTGNGIDGSSTFGQGLAITRLNFTGSGSTNNGVGINLPLVGTGYFVDSCTFSGFASSGGFFQGWGIALVSSGLQALNVRITNCTIQNCTHGGIALNAVLGGYIGGNQINTLPGSAGAGAGNCTGIWCGSCQEMLSERNVLHDISGGGGLYEFTYYSVVRKNQVYNLTTGTDCSGWTLDGTKNCVVEGNYVENTDCPSLWCGGLDDPSTCFFNVIRYNLCVNSSRHSFNHGAILFQPGTSAPISGSTNLIHNNTIYQEAIGGGIVGAQCDETDTTDAFVNNLIFLNDASGQLVVCGTAPPNAFCSGNGYYVVGQAGGNNFSAQIPANTYTSIATWRSGANQETFQSQNLGFVRNPNFKSINPAAFLSGQLPVQLFRTTDATLLTGGIDLRRFYTALGRADIPLVDFYGTPLGSNPPVGCCASF